MPISPLLSSTLPRPQMNSPEKNTQMSSLKHYRTTNHVSYRHSTQSKVGVSIFLQSRGLPEPHLQIQVVSVALVGGHN